MTKIYTVVSKVCRNSYTSDGTDYSTSSFTKQIFNSFISKYLKKKCFLSAFEPIRIQLLRNYRKHSTYSLGHATRAGRRRTQDEQTATRDHQARYCGSRGRLSCQPEGTKRCHCITWLTLNTERHRKFSLTGNNLKDGRALEAILRDHQKTS